MRPPHRRELFASTRKPVATSRLGEVGNSGSMTRQQRRSYIVTRDMKMPREKLQSLRRIPKTMQEENPSGIPLLHVYGFGAFLGT